MKLALGIIDIPYHINVPQKLRRVGVKVRKGGKPQAFSAAPAGGKSTGDVAEILEEKYHVYEHFYEARQEEIGDAIAGDLQDFLEDRLSGSPANDVNFTGAESTIKTLFQNFIDGREMDRLGFPGIPTQASLNGVNHRLKHPYAKGNPARPSFKDTGTYEQSFIAKIEE